MIRNVSFGRYVLPAVALAMVACGGDDDGGATPTPTPVPPADDYFRLTAMTVGDSSTGVDLDGDGSVDNNIENALEEIQASLLVVIEDALATAGVPFGDECSQGTPCGDVIMDQVANILEATLSVDALSDAINTPISNGTVNYLLEFKEEAVWNLYWYLGEFLDTGIAPSDLLGVQAGPTDLLATGAGTFGPGDLSLTFTFTVTNPTNPSESNEIVIPFTLYGGLSEVSGYNQDNLSNFVAGGAVSMNDLLAIVEATLDNVNEVLPPDQQLPVDEILTTMETALVPYADVDLDSNGANDAFSIGLEAEGKSIVPVQ